MLMRPLPSCLQPQSGLPKKPRMSLTVPKSPMLLTRTRIHEVCASQALPLPAQLAVDTGYLDATLHVDCDDLAIVYIHAPAVCSLSQRSPRLSSRQGQCLTSSQRPSKWVHVVVMPQQGPQDAYSCMNA